MDFLATKHEQQSSVKNPKGSELSETIFQLANQGRTASEIGLILRDQQDIHSVKELTGKRISQILKEKGIVQEIPEDLMNLIRTSVKLQKHLVQNKKDTSAKRGYQLAVSKIRKLARYYIRENKLPARWRYTSETAQLLVK